MQGVQRHVGQGQQVVRTWLAAADVLGCAAVNDQPATAIHNCDRQSENVLAAEIDAAILGQSFDAYTTACSGRLAAETNLDGAFGKTHIDPEVGLGRDKVSAPRQHLANGFNCRCWFIAKAYPVGHGEIASARPHGTGNYRAATQNGCRKPDNPASPKFSHWQMHARRVPNAPSEWSREFRQFAQQARVLRQKVT